MRKLAVRGRDIDVALVVFAEVQGEADHGIADEIRPADVVITADIPLATHCVEGGAAAVAPHGREFTGASICNALASPDIKAHAQESGIGWGGPPPMAARDRSRFANELDRIACRAMRASRS